MTALGRRETILLIKGPRYTPWPPHPVASAAPHPWVAIIKLIHLPLPLPPLTPKSPHGANQNGGNLRPPVGSHLLPNIESPSVRSNNECALPGLTIELTNFPDVVIQGPVNPLTHLPIPLRCTVPRLLVLTTLPWKTTPVVFLGFTIVTLVSGYVNTKLVFKR